METQYVDSEIGNYYGSAQVKRDAAGCFMCVENWNGCDWTPISQEFFDAFVKEFGGAIDGNALITNT